ncbi:MAG: tetratricopeptide repeat protein [Tepidisphaeraceae bacterium]
MTVGEMNLTDRSRRAIDLGIFAAVVIIALAIRVAFVLQARTVVFFDLLVVDAKSYDTWAQRIVSGDWLGQDVFYQAPLYPYFLAIVQGVVGHDMLRVRLVQAGIGSVSCGLLFLAGRAFFGRAVGAIAGLMLAVYPTSVFLDSLIQKSVLDLLFSTMLLWVLARVWFARDAWRWIVVGLVLGLLCLTRENALLLVGVFVVAALIHQRQIRIGTRAARVAWFMTGIALVLLPVGIRNRIVGGEFALTTSQAGSNFFIGNNPNATGIYAPLVPGHNDPPQERFDAVQLAERGAGRSLTPNEVSRYWFGQAWGFIREQPGAWLSLMGRKCALVINAYEVPDAEDQYFYETSSPVLRALRGFWHFGILLPLFLVGVVLTIRRARELWILYAMWISLAAGVAFFYVFARYRFPLVPVMMIFAAAGLVELVAAIRARQVPRLLVASACAVLAAVASNWVIFTPGAHLAASYLNAGAALNEVVRLPESVDYLRRAVASDPGAPEGHVGLGLALGRMGRLTESTDEFLVALSINPNDAKAHFGAGTSFGVRGLMEPAAHHLQRALAMDPYNRRAVTNLYTVLATLGRWPQAIEVLRDALRANPGDPVLEWVLSGALSSCPVDSLRNAGESLQLAESAVRKAPEQIDAQDALARAYAESGRFDDAVATVNRALDLARRQNNRVAIDMLHSRLTLFQSQRALRAQ